LTPVAAAPAQWHEFAGRDELATTLAEDVAASLSRAIAHRGVGFLAVSGGTTPAQMFGVLSTEQIDWQKVVVTLIDERNVPESSSRSNAALARRTLLQNRAAAARFVPLYQGMDAIEAAAAEASKVLADLPWPLDAAILGMGPDGHTASFFPDATDLAALLDPNNPAVVMSVYTTAGIEPRLTLPLSRIVASAWLAVHIEGTDKKAVLEAAQAGDSKYPISAVFRQGRKPIDIYWAP
jgi:6-phosphogluconolactonase